MTEKLREVVERFARDDADEDLDAEKWGSAVTPLEVLALLERVRRLEALEMAAMEWFELTRTPNTFSHDRRRERNQVEGVALSALHKAIRALSDKAVAGE